MILLLLLDVAEKVIGLYLVRPRSETCGTGSVVGMSKVDSSNVRSRIVETRNIAKWTARVGNRLWNGNRTPSAPPGSSSSMRMYAIFDTLIHRHAPSGT